MNQILSSLQDGAKPYDFLAQLMPKEALDWCLLSFLRKGQVIRTPQGYALPKPSEPGIITCDVCEEEKSAGSFAVNARGEAICGPCRNKHPRKHRIAAPEEERRARKRALNRKYKAKWTEELKLKDREYRRKRYLANREHENKLARLRYAKRKAAQAVQIRDENADGRIRDVALLLAQTDSTAIRVEQGNLLPVCEARPE